MLPGPLVSVHLLQFSVLSRRGLGFDIEELESPLVFAYIYPDISKGLSIALISASFSCVTVEIEATEEDAGRQKCARYCMRQ
jgi:hypothetical protein